MQIAQGSVITWYFTRQFPYVSRYLGRYLGSLDTYIYGTTIGGSNILTLARTNAAAPPPPTTPFPIVRLFRPRERGARTSAFLG